jgi:hypothetical protein
MKISLTSSEVQPMRIIPGNGKDTSILIMDEQGPGGANHVYRVVVGKNDYQPTKEDILNLIAGFNKNHSYLPKVVGAIDFQKGGVVENGVNGLQIEDLLSIAIDRLTCFQHGPFNSALNAEALAYIQKGLDCLKSRTAKRVEQGIEGREVSGIDGA